MSISNLMQSQDASYLDLKVDSISANTINLPLLQESILLTNSSGLVQQRPYDDGTWDAQATGIANVTTITVENTFYQMINNVVYARITGTLQTTSSATALIQIQLPLAKSIAFTDKYELSGSGTKYNVSNGTGSGISIYAEVASLTTCLIFVHDSTVALDDFEINFSYSLN